MHLMVLATGHGMEPRVGIVKELLAIRGKGALILVVAIVRVVAV